MIGWQVAAAGDGILLGTLAAWLIWPRGPLARRVHSAPTKPVRTNTSAPDALRLPWPFLAMIGALTTTLVQPWGPVPALAGASLIAGAIVVSGPVFTWWEKRRMAARQAFLFPDWLAALAVSVEVGIPLSSALHTAASATSREMSTFATELAHRIDLGEPLEQSLDRFTDKLGLSEARFVSELLVRHHTLGTSLEAVLLREEGLLSRLRWIRHHREEQLLPYAFALSVGVLLTDAFLVLAIPRITLMVNTMFHGLPS